MITISTAQYEWAYGKKPRGNGTWFFFNSDETWSYFFWGSYTDARKAARAMAKHAGVTFIKVGT